MCPPQEKSGETDPSILFEKAYFVLTKQVICPADYGILAGSAVPPSGSNCVVVTAAAPAHVPADSLPPINESQSETSLKASRTSLAPREIISVDKCFILKLHHNGGIENKQDSTPPPIPPPVPCTTSQNQQTCQTPGTAYDVNWYMLAGMERNRCLRLTGSRRFTWSPVEGKHAG